MGTAMSFRVAMLLMALLDASSAFSPAGVSLMSRSRVMPARPAHGLQRLRMEEKADEEAAPAPMDFTPATPAPAAAEEKGFDPTQYSITISIFFLFCVVKAFSYFGIVDFDD